MPFEREFDIYRFGDRRSPSPPVSLMEEEMMGAEESRGEVNFLLEDSEDEIFENSKRESIKTKQKRNNKIRRIEEEAQRREEKLKRQQLRKSGENALIISSKEEKNARKFADKLAKAIKVDQIGGTPKGVRTIRDGKLVIVPMSKEQKEKLEEGLKKVKGLEIKEKKAVEPMVEMSGFFKCSD